MKENKPSKKQKIKKFLAVSSIVTSLILSSLALYYTSDLDELKSGRDGESTLTRIGSLYGTHGCEEGGFSIQIGIDLDDDESLDGEEVSEIKNVCHGKEGPPGPMGNRGYWGYNGTNGSDGIDGLNGSDGLIGTSSFIGSYVGNYGPCPQAAVIEMGNNSTSGIVDSSIKICFENLTSGRLTDIHLNSGDSFSTACNGGYTYHDVFLFAAAREGNCLLYKIEEGQVTQLSDDVDFLPGSILGFEQHEDRIWFDADDGTGSQLWSSDGESIWKETNLSSPLQQGDELVSLGEDLILNYQGGILIFSDSETLISGTYSNMTTANQILIYNTISNIYLGGSILDGEIHSDATFHEGYYWFIASSDSNGPQLHRANSAGLERMTTGLHSLSGQTISPTILGDNVVFDSDGLYSFNTSSLILSEMNSTIQNIAQDADWVVHNGLLWFTCGIPTIGYELCASDGEDAWLHFDHISGMDSSNPSHLAIVGNNLLTLINDPVEGGQLHLVTELGLELLWDHDSGDLDSGTHGELWVGEEFVFFIADNSTLGLEMYGWAHGVLNEEWIIIH